MSHPSLFFPVFGHSSGTFWVTIAGFSVSASGAGAGTSPWVICLSHCGREKKKMYAEEWI